MGSKRTYLVCMDNSSTKYNIRITEHAKDRFVERFGEQFLKQNDLLAAKMLSIFKQSKESSTFLNNTSLLQHFYDRYGYARKHFYLYDNLVVFVCDKTSNEDIVILTCMKASNSFVLPKKFRKKDKVKQDDVEDLDTDLIAHVHGMRIEMPKEQRLRIDALLEQVSA